MKKRRRTQPTYCGSRLAVEPSSVSVLIGSLGVCSEVARNASPLVLEDAHNAMALHTLMMLLFATGHRAVKDPFFSLDIFNLDRAECLIEDKVVAASRHARLVWLPQIAVTQLRHYLSHLRALSKRLYRVDEDLARDIMAVAQPQGPRPMPLFFFLEKRKKRLRCVPVTPRALSQRLDAMWSYPLNANRHVLATGLREVGCPAELVEVQLGHVEAGISPFGAHSVLSPERVGRTLRAFLDRYAQTQEWFESGGLPALPGAYPSHANERDIESARMGPAERQDKRNATWRAESQVVANLFADFVHTESPREISDEEVHALEGKLFARHSAAPATLIRLTLFRRHLLKLRRAGFQVRVPGRLAVVREEPSPFARDTLATAGRAEQARGRFLQYLAGRSSSIPAPEHRVAEIIISAVLFGALLAKDLQAQIPGRLGAGFHYADAVAFIDFSYNPVNPDAPVRRWFPDSVTLSLIAGLWRSTRGVVGKFDGAQVVEHARQILLALGVPHGDARRNGRAASEQTLARALARLLAPLTSLAVAYWSLRLPSVVREYALTEDFSASLPLANWYRVLTGRKIRAKHGQMQTVPSPVAHYETLAPTRGVVASMAQAQVAWKELKPVLSPTHLRSNVPRTRKRALEDELARFASKSAVRDSPIATLFCAWLLHLCRYGTSHQRDLRASSIITYASTIGPSLLTFGGPLNMLALTDVGFEELYSRVVEVSLRRNVAYVAERLREFHHFLTEAYAVPRVDWREVFEGSQLAAVDATVITRREYIEALRTVLADEDAAERDRQLHGFILVMAYRFGLRTGEIFRLTGGDILRHGDEVVLYVRNSPYGFTKTHNGVRQVPLLGRLLPDEHRVIDQWLGHIDFYATDFARAALLSKANLERQVIERSAAVARVVQALRKATGDDDVRLRHLRHTFGSRNFLYAYCEGVPSGALGQFYAALADDDITPAEVRTKLLGNEALSYRVLHAISAVHGHGSPKTTLGSYIHGLDVALHDEVSRDAGELPAKALSYALSATPGNVRQLLSRQKRGLKTTVALSHHFLAPLFRGDLPPDLMEVSTKSQDAPNPRTDAPHLKPVDVDWLLSFAGLRGSLDGVADRLLVSEFFMRDLLSAASRLQEHTGFADFGLPVYLPEDKWVPGVTTRSSQLDKEAARARAFLLGVEEDEATLESVRTLCAAWVSAYRPSAPELLFSHRPLFYEFLDASQRLGIASDSFEVLISGQAGEEGPVWASICAELAHKNLRVAHRKRLPPSRAGAKSNRIGLMLRSHPDHQLGYQRTLNRVIFVLLCYLEQTTVPILAQDLPLKTGPAHMAGPKRSSASGEA